MYIRIESYRLLNTINTIIYNTAIIMKIDEVKKKLLTANEVPRTCSKQVAIAWRDKLMS